VKTVVPALTVLIPAAYFMSVSVCGQKTLMEVAAEKLEVLFCAMAQTARQAIAATDLNMLMDERWSNNVITE